ncbi:MAG: S8 family serine peptidase [Burkholderiales bacterium]|nr:S8 family serine peptidase [Burkholderiales bacterium]
MSNLHANQLDNYGYDFYDPINSDGLERGDFVAQDEYVQNSRAANSSWHGSHVTGMIVGNGLDGVYGGAYGAKVVPIRVLGKCGGTATSISNAIMWAIDEFPDVATPQPADIINLSLGGKGSCPHPYQSAIVKALSKGVIVVANLVHQWLLQA